MGTGISRIAFALDVSAWNGCPAGAVVTVISNAGMAWLSIELHPDTYTDSLGD